MDKEDDPGGKEISYLGAGMGQMSPVETAAYTVIFAVVGFLFLFAALCLGRLLRPHRPSPLKQAVYECGETSVGPSDLQFDLRFYVAALVFIVFEIELAFFFPWANVFGKLVRQEKGLVGVRPAVGAEPTAKDVPDNFLPPARRPAAVAENSSRSILPSGTQEAVRRTSRPFVWLAAGELGVFLAIVFVGFFYIWRQGDLDWVRALEAFPPAQETVSGQSPLQTSPTERATPSLPSVPILNPYKS